MKEKNLIESFNAYELPCSKMKHLTGGNLTPNSEASLSNVGSANSNLENTGQDTITIIDLNASQAQMYYDSDSDNPQGL